MKQSAAKQSYENVGFRSSTQPCILEIVVDRPNLGQERPLCSMGHYNNLFDRTRTVARGKNFNTDI
ncbi:hypothetical protein [Nostoc punctiforme]|uniref:hypothetical protein n=1 Tax=Nostoc punctiforme TaxID=272131 RepID=UPI000045BD8E|nr:hypothetical protein [Nostoc punctiforme]